jgi:hypothetical protein
MLKRKSLQLTTSTVRRLSSSQLGAVGGNSFGSYQPGCSNSCHCQADSQFCGTLMSDCCTPSVDYCQSVQYC